MEHQWVGGVGGDLVVGGGGVVVVVVVGEEQTLWNSVLSPALCVLLEEACAGILIMFTVAKRWSPVLKSTFPTLTPLSA